MTREARWMRSLKNMPLHVAFGGSSAMCAATSTGASKFGSRKGGPEAEIGEGSRGSDGRLPVGSVARSRGGGDGRCAGVPAAGVPGRRDGGGNENSDDFSSPPGGVEGSFREPDGVAIWIEG